MLSILFWDIKHRALNRRHFFTSLALLLQKDHNFKFELLPNRPTLDVIGVHLMPWTKAYIIY